MTPERLEQRKRDLHRQVRNWRIVMWAMVFVAAVNAAKAAVILVQML